MRSTRFTIIRSLGIALVVYAGACSSSGDGDTTGKGGSGATSGTAGTSGSAGTTGSGGGGAVGAAGTLGSGGSPGAAGTTGTGRGGTTGTGATAGSGNSSGAAGDGGTAGGSGSAGNSGAGGSTGPGTGGDGAGGVTGGGGRGGRGGTTGGGGMTGGRGGGAGGRGGAAGTGIAGSGAGGTGATGTGGVTGGGGSGACQKGQTKGSDVAVLGESFYAISPQYIVNRIQDNARKAGSLGASDTYHYVAVSGQNMNYIATTEWTAATANGGMPKWIIMDGGGIDCLNGGGATCTTCSNTFKTLLGKMGTAGVKEVIYTRYPEPGNPPGSNASLKGCLDATMPMMQTTCEGSTSPKCHWVDLRPVWVNGDTTDGLHPTQSGGNHVGDLIWSEMMKECFAQ
jgi:hypothetical protein